MSWTDDLKTGCCCAASEAPARNSAATTSRRMAEYYACPSSDWCLTPTTPFGSRWCLTPTAIFGSRWCLTPIATEDGMKKLHGGLLVAAGLAVAISATSAQQTTPYKLGMFEQNGRQFVGMVLNDARVVD